MVIYFEGVPRAIYFDSEGHVIRYNVTFPSSKIVVFESDGTQPGPLFRLSYWMEKGWLQGQFEIAPPSGEYQKYMSWVSHKN
jgi:hypothetical protein